MNCADQTTHRAIFENVIAPLANVWKDSEVRASLKEHVVILIPKASDTC
jgi:hypothetical protein